MGSPGLPALNLRCHHDDLEVLIPGNASDTQKLRTVRLQATPLRTLKTFCPGCTAVWFLSQQLLKAGLAFLHSSYSNSMTFACRSVWGSNHFELLSSPYKRQDPLPIIATWPEHHLDTALQKKKRLITWHRDVWLVKVSLVGLALPLPSR